jgi:predicted O-methyltransferase YrrM
MKELKSIINEKQYLNKLINLSEENKIPVIDYEVGRLLETIIFTRSPRFVLEIGCGEGYSSYFIVKNLKKASFTGIDLNCKRLQKAKEFITSGFPKIISNFYCGNALNIIPALNDKFDFVFIDAAKFEYPDYLEVLFEKLESNSIIVADNIFYDEKIFNRYIKEHDKNSVRGLKKFIKKIQNKSIFDTKFINIGDGISVSVFKQ